MCLRLCTYAYRGTEPVLTCIYLPTRTVVLEPVLTYLHHMVPRPPRLASNSFQNACTYQCVRHYCQICTSSGCSTSPTSGTNTWVSLLPGLRRRALLALPRRHPELATADPGELKCQSSRPPYTLYRAHRRLSLISRGEIKCERALPPYRLHCARALAL